MIRRLIAALALLLANPAGAQSIISGLVSGSPADVPQYATPSTGSTVTMGDGMTLLIVDNSSLLAVLNVNLPPSPVDGQRVVIASGSGVTLLTVSGNGHTIKGAIAALSANGWVRYAYSTTAGAWFRTG